MDIDRKNYQRFCDEIATLIVELGEESKKDLRVLLQLMAALCVAKVKSKEKRVEFMSEHIQTICEILWPLEIIGNLHVRKATTKK